MAGEAIIYHNPKCSTSRMVEHPILIERPFIVTPTGTRLACPIDGVREIP